MLRSCRLKEQTKPLSIWYFHSWGFGFIFNTVIIIMTQHSGGLGSVWLTVGLDLKGLF